MLNYFPTQDGDPFPCLIGFMLCGDGWRRQFKVEQAWDRGWVAHTIDGRKKIDVQGDTALQAWRKLQRILVTQDGYGSAVQR